MVTIQIHPDNIDDAVWWMKWVERETRSSVASSGIGMDAARLLLQAPIYSNEEFYCICFRQPGKGTRRSGTVFHGR